MVNPIYTPPDVTKFGKGSKSQVGEKFEFENLVNRQLSMFTTNLVPGVIDVYLIVYRFICCQPLD